MATYARKEDSIHFYEINPLVKRLAYEYFSFLENSQAKIEIVLGDARVMLDWEEPRHFDVLVVDAFTGDVIPTHLLTREAFALYLRKQLKPDGVLAVHVSSRYLDLVPIVARIAAEFAVTCRRVQNSQDDEYSSESDWILITRNERFLQDPVIAERATPIPLESTNVPLWTDQYNNLIQILGRR